MITKISETELRIFEVLHHPISCAEVLWHDFDDLGAFDSEKFGKIRMYQYPFQSYDTLFLFDPTLSSDPRVCKKKNFNIKKGLADIYALGGRLTGKTFVVLKLDILMALLHKTFNWAVVSSLDALHLRGVMEIVIGALDNHPILKQLDAESLHSLPYKITTNNGCLVQSVNENFTGKNSGGQWYGLHVDKEWAEEASFITDEVNRKKLKAVSEMGCVFRYGGMTTFSTNSPMGRIFANIKNRNKIVNLPSYVNPNYDAEEDEKNIQEFGGKNSTGYLVQVQGKVVEHGESVYIMEKIRDTYNWDVPILSYEINEDNLAQYKDVLILEKPNNADCTMIALDKGEGSAPTEIIVLFKVNGVWQYRINVTNFKLAPDDDKIIVEYLIELLSPNVVAIDRTSGSGLELFCYLENKHPKHIVDVSFNENINVDFEKDEKGEVVHDKAGEPVYKQSRVDDWSVQCLKDIFYNKKIKCLCDYKLDLQFNGVISMKSGNRVQYKYKTANHLYQAFQVAAIADWKTNFAELHEIKKSKPALGAW